MNHINVPGSELVLYPGDIVTLGRFPDRKWILNQDWYLYGTKVYFGWYFTSIPENTVLPVNLEDLKFVTLVSSQINAIDPPFPTPPPIPVWPYPPCPPYPPQPPEPPYPPTPPTPEPEQIAYFTKSYETQLQEAFLSVETIEDRDSIDLISIPNGKVVRVNDVEGQVKYYAWSSSNEDWQELDVVTEDELNSDLDAIRAAIEAAKARWSYL